MSSKKVDVLARLFDTIISHANEDPSKSYTAKLISEGKSKCIEKLKEESLETVEAAEKDTIVNITREAPMVNVPNKTPPSPPQAQPLLHKIGNCNPK